MREVNLISVVQAFNALDQSIYNNYFKLFGIQPDQDELKDLESFLEQLNLINKDMYLIDRYFLNYSIPQISKEFDLLRIGDQYVVNIELKRESTKEKITKQLEKNRYYLSFLGKEMFSYTYVSSENQLYSLTSDHSLVKNDFVGLSKILSKQKCQNIDSIDNLFNPSNYLVSPFNSTERFVDGEYFLTGQQETIKNEFLRSMKSDESPYFSIYGKAGTGKTLLTYDIAKEITKTGSKVLTIHCGKLNQGHHKLREEYKWDIVSIKDWSTRDLAKYHLVVIDEVQRIYPSQLAAIMYQIKSAKSCCIFSYDKRQCLRKWETNNNIEQQITEEASPKKFNLTEKIRTNKEISSFIIGLFDKSKKVKKAKRANIELNR